MDEVPDPKMQGMQKAIVPKDAMPSMRRRHGMHLAG